MRKNKHNKWARGTIVMLFICTLPGTHVAAQGTLDHQPYAKQPTALNVPQINGDFTLEYTAITTTNNSADAKERMYRINSGGIDEFVKQGRITAEDAEQRKAELRKSILRDQPPQKSKVVLSSRDGKLLYHITGTPGEAVYIWDGKYSYSYDSSSKMLSVDAGLCFKPMLSIMCPGAGFLAIPMIRLETPNENPLELRGDVFVASIGENGPIFRTGTLSFTTGDSTIPVPAVMSWFDAGKLRGKWEFSGSALLGTVCIARHIREVHFDSLSGQKLAATPTFAYSTDYTLTGCTSNALPNEQFLPASYMEPASHDQPEHLGSVVDWRDSAHPVQFPFRGGSSLDQQRDREVKFTIASAAHERARLDSRRGTGGPILLTLLVIGAAWWLVRRRLAPIR